MQVRRHTRQDRVEVACTDVLAASPLLRESRDLRHDVDRTHAPGQRERAPQGVAAFRADEHSFPVCERLIAMWEFPNRGQRMRHYAVTAVLSAAVSLVLWATPTLAFTPDATTCPIQISKLAAKIYKDAMKCAQLQHSGKVADRFSYC